MHDILKERLWRSIEALPEDRLYQVLDYVEFLASKYARDRVQASSPLQRFGERLEDGMRLNGVGLAAIRGTMQVMGAADKVVTDLAQAGRSLLRDVEEGLRSATAADPARELPPGSTPPASPPTGPVKGPDGVT
jgi:hypothetical protein